jgi:hypothetical protein
MAWARIAIPLIFDPRHEEETMTKVGRFVTDPKAGAYCQMTLDNRDKVVVNHDKGGFKGGWLIIERLKLFGLSSERLFACDMDSEEGKTALSFLTRAAPPHSLEATPLGAFINYLKTCRSVDEVKARRSALMALHRSSGG